MLSILAILSCSKETATVSTSDTSISDATYIEDTLLLRRISLDIRGKLPSYEEYIEVQESDTIDWPSIITEYLDSPDFEEHLVIRYGDMWHTRIDGFEILPEDFGLDSLYYWYPLSRSVGEEPLRLLAYIGSHDLPWTEIVTADYTMGNALLADIFPILPDNDSFQADRDWNPYHYTDGRPAVGVLATNGLWWRYPTDSFNMNRTRAATISKLLLCDDYLARPVRFSAGSSILEDTNLALQQDPACLTCHSSLDPLAASMFGFWWIERYNPLEAVYYHPEREMMGEEMMNIAPAWFGQPVQSFAEVGQLIAQDIRFQRCTVEQVQEMLLQRQWQIEDYNNSVRYQHLLKENNFQIKELWKAIILDTEYRLATENSLFPYLQTDRMLSPYQIAHSLQTLTGYEWIANDQDLMDIDYRSMAGGIDGYQTFSKQLFPNLSSVLVRQRIAQAHAAYVVENSFATTTGILRMVTESTSSNDVEFTEQLQYLRLLLHGIVADDDWLQDTTALWEISFARAYQEHPEDASKFAWESTVSAMLQDIDFVRY